MKKILIITSDSGKTASWKDRETYVDNFANKVEAIVADCSVSYTTYTNLIFSVLSGRPIIYDSKNKLELSEFDFVHFKNWQYELEDASVIASYLEQKGVAFANSEVHTRLHMNKLSQAFTLAFAGLPVPDTLYSLKPRGKIFTDLLRDSLTYPMIVKANDSARGDSNYLVKDYAELVAVLKNEPDKHFIFQGFVENDGDLRLLYIGLDNKPIVFLRKGAEGTHLNNTSKGGEGKLMSFEALPQEIKTDAFMAAKVLGREISGVDIIIDKNSGKHYVLEVNSTPALATGFALDEKVKLFSKYLSTAIEEREEE